MTKVESGTVSKIAVVTGANRGIGLEVVRSLSRAGYSVIGLARTPPKEEFEGELIQCDLGDRDAVKRACAQLAGRTVSILVNNAGIIGVDNFENFTPENFERVMAVNVLAPLMLMNAVVDGMRRQHYGRIVNIGSRAALGKKERLSYSASKAALIGLTRTSALELAPSGITVNVVSPGPVETEIFYEGNPAKDGEPPPLVKSIPVRRMGQTQDIAAAVTFLTSPEAGYITGQTLLACGGLSVGAMAL